MSSETGYLIMEELLSLDDLGTDNSAEKETPWGNGSISPHENLSESENSSANPLLLPLDMQFNEGHKMAIVMYTGVMVVSALGNMYVFLAIMRLRKFGKLSRITLLLLHLAIADLLVTFVMMPLEIFWNVTVSWLAGDWACRILSFFRVFGLYLSGFVVICLCLDRYFAIMTPMAVVQARTRGRKLLVGAWIASGFCSLPQSFIFHVESHPKFTWYEQCVTFNSFPSPGYELAYNLFGFIFMYALPMAAVLACYSCILCKMYGIVETKPSVSQLRRSSVAVIKRAQTKTLRMTVITITAFSICWTPYNIISLWYWFDKSSAVELDPRIQKTLFAFACTNSCVNPLIYGWYHMSRHQGKRLNATCHQYQRTDISGERFLNSSLSPLQLSVQPSSRLPSPMREGGGMNLVVNPLASPSHWSGGRSWGGKTAEKRKGPTWEKVGRIKMVNLTNFTGTAKQARGEGKKVSFQEEESLLIMVNDRRLSGGDVAEGRSMGSEEDQVSRISV